MEERESASSSAASAIKRTSKFIILAALTVLIGYVMIRFCFNFGRSLFYVDPAEAAPGTDVELIISEDDTIDTIAVHLYGEGAITNARSFKVQGMLYGTGLYPGTYTVNTSMTIKEMLTAIDERAEELEEEAETSAAAETAGDEISGGYEGDGANAEGEAVDMANAETEGADYSADGSADNAASGTEEVIGGGDEGE